MKRGMLWLLVAGVALFWAGTADAGKKGGKGGKKSAEQRFEKADTNGDGKLSLDEFIGKRTDDKKEKATRRFKKLDANSDESLSLDEFKAGDKPKK